MITFKYFEFLIAWRYLKSKRKDGFISVISWLSLVGIALGVATLIIVMSVMNGFREEMLSKILGMNGHIMILPNNPTTGIRDYETVIANINKIPSLVNTNIITVPAVEAQVMLAGQNTSTGGILKGIDFNDIEKLTPLAKGLKEDITKLEDGEVLLGTTLARKLNLHPGANITITTAKGNVTAFGTIPRVKAYPIGAVFTTGMSTYDTNFVYLPLDWASHFLNSEGKVDYIEVFLDNPYDSIDVARSLNTMLGPHLRATTWQQQNSSFVSALDVERNVMFLILTLIILVASFNIISSLVMLVKDKSHDIAVLKTIGVNKFSVMKIFFISGSLLGISGTVIGTFLGLVISDNIELVRQFFQTLTGTKLFPDDIYFLSELPSKIDMTEVLWVFIMSILISFLATIYPSRKAAKMQPIDVLRYE